MSINSTNPRRLAIAAGYGALAVGLPYGAIAYASSPEKSAWALMAVCICGLGFAGYRRSRSNRLSRGID
jgi:lysozyme family protein